MMHGLKEKFALLVDLLAGFLVGLQELYEFLGHSICFDADLSAYGRAWGLGFLNFCKGEKWTTVGHISSTELTCRSILTVV